MAEQPPKMLSPLSAAPEPGERTPALVLVAVVNLLIAAAIVAQVLSATPALIASAPTWYRGFLIAEAAILGGSGVGLLRLRRWGFGLMMLGYALALLSLVIMRQNWLCQGAMLFPLIAVAGRNWRALR